MKHYSYCLFGLGICFQIMFVACKKNDKDVLQNRPKAEFTFTILNQGFLPDTVNFKANQLASYSYYWDFGNGAVSDLPNPQLIYKETGTYNVKLVVKNNDGADSIIKPVSLTLNKPVVNFDIITGSQEILPLQVFITNNTIGSNISYSWSFGSGNTSNLKVPSVSYIQPGIYTIKLIGANASGSDSLSKQVRVYPYQQPYRTFNGMQTNLYAWEGEDIVIFSRNNNLNRNTMFKWVKAMNDCYRYYELCTGGKPTANAPYQYINNKSTIADVASTCGAACGYLGATGIEIQNNYFDIVYNRISTKNEFEHFPFYEFGRNFWFYGDKIAYKANDPVTTGYAVFMGFMAMKAAGVKGNSSHVQENIIDLYLANNSLNWGNTLGTGQSVPGSNTSGPDLFSSFCFRLMRDYGGEAFVQNLWKKVATRPVALTTQDAVDNFILAASASANKNLTSIFLSWRWPVSSKAIEEAKQYP